MDWQIEFHNRLNVGFTLGWAYHPRKVKTDETVEIKFDNGVKHVVTPDHRFLLMSGEWREAGDLKYGDKLKLITVEGEIEPGAEVS